MTLDALMGIRSGKQRPVELVILSLVGPLALPNPVIEVQERPSDLDLRPLIDLDVEIAHCGQVQKVVTLVDAVHQQNVRYLGCWNVDTGDRVQVSWCGEIEIRSVTA